jgi:hypothetical protein
MEIFIDYLNIVILAKKEKFLILKLKLNYFFLHFLFYKQ